MRETPVRYALEPPICFNLSQCLPHILLTAWTAYFLECELPLMVEEHRRQCQGSSRDELRTHPAVLILREVHEREPALS